LKVEERGEGDVSVKVESFDDLWKLSFFVKPAYVLIGRTSRQLKLRDEGGDVRGKRRLSMTMAIEVEKVEFQPFTESMRFLGKVVAVEEGMEWVVQRGEHHAISVGVGDEVEVKKQGRFDAIERKLLEKESSGPLALVVSLDMSDASLAVLWGYGVERLLSIRSKREEEDAHLDEFFSEVEEALGKEILRREVKDVLISGPSVVLSEFKKHLERKGRFSGKKLNINFAPSSYGGDEGLELLLDNPDLRKYADSIRLLKEKKMVQEVFERLSLGEGVAVGVDEVEKASQEGRVKTLLIVASLLYEPPEDLMEIVDGVKKSGGQIELISEEGGRELKGLGGLAAILW